jgi:hypothetical protein
MLSHRYQDMQHQATSLEETAKQTGLLINPQKTKTMRINTTQTDKLTIRDTEVEHVEQADPVYHHQKGEEKGESLVLHR